VGTAEKKKKKFGKKKRGGGRCRSRVGSFPALQRKRGSRERKKEKGKRGRQSKAGKGQLKHDSS